MNLKKDFYNLLINAFYGKTMEDVCNRIEVEFIRKIDTDKIIKQESKLTFRGNHKSHEKYDSYTFKQNEVFMEKPFDLSLSVLKLSKLLKILAESSSGKVQFWMQAF